MKRLQNLLVASVLLLGGCALFEPSFQIETNGITTSAYEGQKGNAQLYEIVPSEAQRDSFENDLVLSSVKQVCERHGMRVTKAGERARYSIEVDYGVSAPEQMVEQMHEPIIGETDRRYFVRGGVRSFSPSYGITGYSTTLRTYDVYRKWLVLSVYDVSVPGTKKPLWKTEIVNTGRSRDFRELLPYLLYVLDSRIAENTGGIVRDEVSEKQLKEASQAKVQQERQ